MRALIVVVVSSFRIDRYRFDLTDEIKEGLRTGWGARAEPLMTLAWELQQFLFELGEFIWQGRPPEVGQDEGRASRGDGTWGAQCPTLFYPAQELELQVLRARAVYDSWASEVEAVLAEEPLLEGLPRV